VVSRTERLPSPGVVPHAVATNVIERCRAKPAVNENDPSLSVEVEKCNLLKARVIIYSY